jgi:hypothetical protein
LGVSLVPLAGECVVERRVVVGVVLVGDARGALGLLLAGAPQALGVEGENDDVDQEPDQRRQQDDPAGVYPQFSVEHVGRIN